MSFIFPMRTSREHCKFSFLFFLFFLNKPHDGLSGKGPIEISDTVTFLTIIPRGWELFTVFLAGPAVLEHITKPQRPNVFLRSFGLCFLAENI